MSDNTRTKIGRRRPFFIFGGILAGVSMIVFAFSGSFVLCLILDGIIVSIGTNAYIAAEKSLIPDTFEQKYRGRANGIIYILGNVGLIIALALFLVADMFFSEEDPQLGSIMTHQGFIILLCVGGGFLIIGGIVGTLFVREVNIKELPPRKKFFEELSETLTIRELRKHKEFGKLMLARIIFQTAVGIIMPYLFIYIFAIGLSTIELLIAIMVVSFPIVFGVSYLFGFLSDRFGRKKFIPIAILIIAVILYLTRFIGDPGTGDYDFVFVLICFPGIMVALLAFDGSLDAWSQDMLPEGKRGQFNGFFNIIFTLNQIIGAFIASQVVDLSTDLDGNYLHIDTLKNIFPAAAIAILCSIPFFLWVKDTFRKNNEENNIEGMSS